MSRPSQSPGLAVSYASASALECKHAPPSQCILGTQDVQTGISMRPLPQQGGDWHCHTCSKRAVGLACCRCCWRARSCSAQIELCCSTPVVVFFFFFFFLSSCRKLRARVTRNREIINSGLMQNKNVCLNWSNDWRFLMALFKYTITTIFTISRWTGYLNLESVRWKLLVHLSSALTTAVLVE